MGVEELKEVLPVSSQQQKMIWDSRYLFGQKMVWRSKAMAQVMQQAQKLAHGLSNVLIVGESGTGKELLARFLHEKSPRSAKPFVAINCATLRDTLLESELFGYEKGAFSGAVQTRKGLVEMAHGGTLFLDEIGEMPLSVQAKFLRFIETGEFYRLGGLEPIRVDVRLIMATNRNLPEAVKRMEFREDLFYRINSIVLELPALRERKEDIPILLDYFIQKGHYQHRRPLLEFSPEAMEVLLKYDWPGNVRELENLVERLQVILTHSKVMLDDLPENMIQQSSRQGLSYDPHFSLADVEKYWILQALEHFRGNKTQAAQALGITVKTLYNKLHEYGVFEKFAKS